MKRPNLDEFVQRKGTPYAENAVTGDEIILFEHEKSNLCLRSMFEEDVNKIAQMSKLGAKNRKRLARKIQMQKSEEYCCILQELHKFDENGERKIVGIAEFNNSDITINIIFQKESSHREYDYEAMSIFARIDSIITDIYDMIGSEGKLTMNRVSV